MGSAAKAARPVLRPVDGHYEPADPGERLPREIEQFVFQTEREILGWLQDAQRTAEASMSAAVAGQVIGAHERNVERRVEHLLAALALGTTVERSIERIVAMRQEIAGLCGDC